MLPLYAAVILKLRSACCAAAAAAATATFAQMTLTLAGSPSAVWMLYPSGKSCFARRNRSSMLLLLLLSSLQRVQLAVLLLHLTHQSYTRWQSFLYRCFANADAKANGHKCRSKWADVQMLTVSAWQQRSVMVQGSRSGSSVCAVCAHPSTTSPESGLQGLHWPHRPGPCSR